MSFTSSRPQRRGLPPASWGIGFFLAGIILVLLFQSARVTRDVDLSGFKGADAVVIFAIAFLLAAAVERLVEALNRAINRVFGDVHYIKGRHSHHEVEAPAIRKDEERRKRVLSSWGLASLLGMVLSYFTVGLFELLGIKISIPRVLESHSLDSIVTGMIIGSGTKPFHDLLTLIERRGEAARHEEPSKTEEEHNH